MGTEKKFKTKAVFFVVLAAIMIILQLPQQVCATEQKDTIVVGTNAEYAPFEYLDSNERNSKRRERQYQMGRSSI